MCIRDSVQTGQRQSRHTHGHEALSHINGYTEHLEETGHTVAEHLEGRAGCRGAVRRGGSTGHTQGQNSQQAFQYHGAVAYLQHVLLVAHGLGGGTGRYQAVETGNRTTGHGNEQDREQGAQAGVVEPGVNRQIHGGMCHQQAQHRTGDHADEHKGGRCV